MADPARRTGPGCIVRALELLALGAGAAFLVGRALPAVVAAWVGRRRRGGVVRSAAVLAFATSVVLGLGSDVGLRPRPAARPGILRLVHWNASWPDSNRGLRPSNELLALEPDVVFFSNPYRFFNDGREETWREHGYEVVIPGIFAVASRVPVIETRTIFVGRDMGAAYVVLDASATLGRTLRVLVVDLPSDPRLSRMSVVSTFRQAMVERGAGDVDLVIGDCNITRGSASLAVLAPGMRDAWDEAGRGWGASWPRGLPLFHLDHAFLAPWLMASGYRLVDLRGGDHLAQEVWIEAVPVE